MNTENCLKRYITRYDEKNKLTKNIANFGLKPLERAKVIRNGEYFGVEIQAVDYILPLFTTYNMLKVYELLQKEEYQDIIQILKIKNEYEKHGNDVVHYIIKKWCNVVHIECPKNIKDIIIADKELDNRIHLNRSDEIVGKFKIINIGSNTNTSQPVLPEDWIGKEFNSGKELHAEMDKLPYRKGSPPVTYCCTYGMTITSDDIKQWIKLNKYENNIFEQYDYFALIEKNNNSVSCKLVDKIDPKKYKDYHVLFLPKSIKFIRMIILIEENIFVKNNKLLTRDNTSYLSSLLQKCFRDQYASHILNETIEKLHYSAGYNLPDQHFARVSGCRQLLWRSYISIIEDVSPYEKLSYQSDLFDLFMLSYVCQIDPEVCLCKDILSSIKNTLLCVQQLNNTWDWKKGYNEFANTKYDDIVKNIKLSSNNKSRTSNAFLLSLTLMPMMKNDFSMISESYSYIQRYSIPSLPTFEISTIEYDEEFNDSVRMIGIDMHCMPNILIQLQGSLPFLPTKKYTLHNLSGFIWDNSSGLNTRYNNIPRNIKSREDLDVLQTLYDIQYSSINKEQYDDEYTWIKTINKINVNRANSILNDNKSYANRLAFLIIFGKKYKLNKKINGKQYDVIVCGTNSKPCKVKKSVDKNKMVYVDGEERDSAEKQFCSEFMDVVSFKQVSPPYGYKWIDTIKNSTCKLSVKMENSKMTFFADNTKLDLFDGSKLIEPIKSEQIHDLPDEFEDILNTIFYNQYDNVFDTILQLFRINKLRNESNDTRIFNWKHLVEEDLRESILYTRSRIMMGREDVQVGPVDRHGHRTLNGISYLYEGVIWRYIVAFSALYPKVFQISGPYKFKINTKEFGYVHLMDSLNYIIDSKINKKKDEHCTDTILTTKLWEHQEKSIKKITYEMFSNNRKGFGDASDVGSGKTLVALGVMTKILEKIRESNTNNQLCNYHNKGFVVLLPTEKLFDTWKTEIQKHTKGFHVIEQYANGKLTDDINLNSIVITTMGRCRDHPIINSWLLTIIDECLTVQNKEALQTEEAWRQSSYSQFGVLMLSATFFRSRFEKMLYMLSMLNTGLPETSDYLDTILSESILCNLGESQRKWIVNTNEIFLDKIKQKQYDEISLKYSEIGFEKVFHLLDKFIRDNVNYIKIFEQMIDSIIDKKKNAKILIYASSKEEANNVSKIKNVGRYPDIKKTHVVVSYAEGTYGLNNLVEFDTILTRPPEPDKLPQMKGRLDRPGQKNDILHLEYVLIKNTIEDVYLYKLEVANNFYGQHILPLAEYYKMAKDKGIVK